MARKPKTFIFVSDESPETILKRMPAETVRYRTEKKQNVAVYIPKDKQYFSLGVEYVGHGDGSYSYEAEIAPFEGGSIIRGELIRTPIFTWPLYGPVRDFFLKIGIVIFYFGFAIPLFLIGLTKCINALIHRRPTNSKRRLIDFMTNYINCRQIKEKPHAQR